MLLHDALPTELVEPQSDGVFHLCMIIPVLAVEETPADELINVGIRYFDLVDLEASLPTVPPACGADRA